MGSAQRGGRNSPGPEGWPSVGWSKCRAPPKKRGLLMAVARACREAVAVYAAAFERSEKARNKKPPLQQLWAALGIGARH